MRHTQTLECDSPLAWYISLACQQQTADQFTVCSLYLPLVCVGGRVVEVGTCQQAPDFKKQHCCNISVLHCALLT